MEINTTLFGKVDIEEEKILSFENGIMGFEECKHFTLIYDSENRSAISWLQAVEEPGLAFPVIDPQVVNETYDPMVDYDYLSSLGEFTADNRFVLAIMTVPENLEDMSVNLKAPIVINTDTKKGCQVIVDDDFEVHYPVYEILKEKKGDK